MPQIFQKQPFILLTILWLGSLIWAQLGGSSDLGWAHFCVCGHLRGSCGLTGLEYPLPEWLLSAACLSSPSSRLAHTWSHAKQRGRVPESRVEGLLRPGLGTGTTSLLLDSTGQSECILEDYSAAGGRSCLFSYPCAVLSLISYGPCFPCHFSTLHLALSGRPALSPFSFSSNSTYCSDSTFIRPSGDVSRLN